MTKKILTGCIAVGLSLGLWASVGSAHAKCPTPRFWSHHRCVK